MQSGLYWIQTKSPVNKYQNHQPGAGGLFKGQGAVAYNSEEVDKELGVVADAAMAAANRASASIDEMLVGRGWK